MLNISWRDAKHLMYKLQLAYPGGPITTVTYTFHIFSSPWYFSSLSRSSHVPWNFLPPRLSTSICLVSEWIPACQTRSGSPILTLGHPVHNRQRCFCMSDTWLCRSCTPCLLLSYIQLLCAGLSQMHFCTACTWGPVWCDTSASMILCSSRWWALLMLATSFYLPICVDLYFWSVTLLTTRILLTSKHK